jgi:hypothetical protein
MAIPACRPIASLVLSVALLAFACAGCGTVVPEQTASPAEEQPTAAPAREAMRDLTPAEKSVLAEGFTAGLDDPESVKFRWAKVPNRLPEHAFEYCGLIDVKSAVGGHTDMKPFLASIRTENGGIIGGTIVALNSDNREENRAIIPKLCRQKGLNPLDAK